MFVLEQVLISFVETSIIIFLIFMRSTSNDSLFFLTRWLCVLTYLLGVFVRVHSLRNMFSGVHTKVNIIQSPVLVRNRLLLVLSPTELDPLSNPSCPPWKTPFTLYVECSSDPMMYTYVNSFDPLTFEF